MRLILQVNKYVQPLIDAGITQEDIARGSAMTRDQLRSLLKADPNTVNRHNLESLCTYLIDKHNVAKSTLPAGLWAFDPDGFWDLLSAREEIHFFTGVRRRAPLDDLMEVAADAMLQTNMLFRVTTSDQTRTSPLVIDQTLVKTWKHSGANQPDIRKEAESVYEALRKNKKETAGLFFGSVKSNPSIEAALAHGFEKAKPFVSEDDVETPPKRSSPVLLLYREDDPQPPSMCAGKRLSKNDPGQGPGYYYEDESGQWQRIAWDDKTDAALVYYRYEKTAGYVEMVAGGFSGEGTSCLADFMRHKEPERFWPPCYEDKQICVGMFLVEFTFGKKKKRVADRVSHAQGKVIPLSANAIEKRIRKISH